MKTFYPFLCTAALLGPGAPLSFATDPVAPATGTVLVVDERHTLEGDIERIADQYRIRHGGGETWLPANKALHLCGNYGEALAYLRTQANLDDADEHLRLALWCRDHNLPTEALTEVREAVKLRPTDSASTALLVRLETDARTTPNRAKATEEDEPVAQPLAVDLTAQCMGQFISHVQPILMNSCASCHANSKTNSRFRLMHTADLGSRKATQENLAAVLNQLNLSTPQASLFLTKALGVHGKMNPDQIPFKNRDAAAFRTLENWVMVTVASNPRLRDTLPPSPAPANVVPTGPVAFGEGRTSPGLSMDKNARPTGLPLAGPPETPPLPKQAASAEGDDPAPTPGSFASQSRSQAEDPVPDAYDPDEFNRANHPPSPPAPPASVPPAPVRPAPR
jgi:hypothetical protein